MLWFSSEIHKGLEEAFAQRATHTGSCSEDRQPLCSTTVELRWQLKRIRYWSWSRST